MLLGRKEIIFCAMIIISNVAFSYASKLDNNCQKVIENSQVLVKKFELMAAAGYLSGNFNNCKRKVIAELVKLEGFAFNKIPIEKKYVLNELYGKKISLLLAMKLKKENDKSIDRVHQLLKFSALSGYSLSQFIYARMLDDGDYFEQNSDEANLYYLMSAYQGNSKAQYNLGVNYMMNKDFVTAEHWLIKASKNKICFANKYLIEIAKKTNKKNVENVISKLEERYKKCSSESKKE